MSGIRDVLVGLREGRAPEPSDLALVVAGIADGTMSDAQVGAFAMGVCHTPLSPSARVAMTQAMRDSGARLAWDLPGPVLDKHSTGGVGDCVSLVLAPALAACGAYLPMISGRGLGHTGGTLDKLEAIPGYDVALSETRLRAVVAEVGCAISGATAAIAPADQRLYGVRDVTGTVPSLDLIVASILSKKLAVGPEALVLDVKVGSGAFMRDIAAARALAEVLVTTAQGAGCQASALITDMSQPLARAAGNALEIVEVMEVLTSPDGSGPLRALVAALGGEVLALGGLAQDPEAGALQVRAVLQDGRAAERFGRMVAAQGGPRDFLDRWRDQLPAAPVVTDIVPERAGYVTEINGTALGEIVVDLGGGRRRDGDRIDFAVGLSGIARLGAQVDPTRPLARLHAPDHATREAMLARVRGAFVLGEAPPEPPALIKERVG